MQWLKLRDFVNRCFPQQWTTLAAMPNRSFVNLDEQNPKYLLMLQNISSCWESEVHFVCFWPKLHSHWRHMQVLHLKLLSAMAGTQTQVHQLWKQLSRRLIILLIELFWNGKAMFLTALFSGFKLLLWIYCSFLVRKMKPLQKCLKPEFYLTHTRWWSLWLCFKSASGSVAHFWVKLSLFCVSWWYHVWK